MQTNIIANLFKELRKNFSLLRENVGNYLQPKIGAVLNEVPCSFFGCVRWQANFEDKRITLDVYATGKIVFNFQTKLRTDEKTSLDTSQDFLEPSMKPAADNYFDLCTNGSLEKLAEEIKKYFNAVPV